MFYVPGDSLSLFLEYYIKNFTRLDNSTLFYQNQTLTHADIKFENSFVGACESLVFAMDSIYQVASVDYTVKILKWPQQNWFYWNGPNTFDWTQWKYGYQLNTNKNEWEYKGTYFDKWLLLIFMIAVILMTIFTEHDLNFSYQLLESITYYWMMFLVFDDKFLFLKQYFRQIDIVVTQFTSAILPNLIS